MKNAFSIATMVTILSLSATAQNDKNKDRLAHIELNAQQKNSVDSVKKAFDEKREVIRKDTSLSKDQRQRKMQDLKKEQNTTINTFLTKGQKKQLKKEKKGKGKKEN